MVGIIELVLLFIVYLLSHPFPWIEAKKKCWNLINRKMYWFYNVCIPSLYIKSTSKLYLQHLSALASWALLNFTIPSYLHLFLYSFNVCTLQFSVGSIVIKNYRKRNIKYNMAGWCVGLLHSKNVSVSLPFWYSKMKNR